MIDPFADKHFRVFVLFLYFKTSSRPAMLPLNSEETFNVCILAIVGFNFYTVELNCIWDLFSWKKGVREFLQPGYPGLSCLASHDSDPNPSSFSSFISFWLSLYFRLNSNSPSTTIKTCVGYRPYWITTWPLLYFYFELLAISFFRILFGTFLKKGICLRKSYFL